MKSIGFISAVLILNSEHSEQDHQLAMSEFETGDEGDTLRSEITSDFAAQCDFALQRYRNRSRCQVRTLIACQGTGWVEYHKGWVRLNCDLIVEDHEVPAAWDWLRDTNTYTEFGLMVEDLTDEFMEKWFGEGGDEEAIFEGCSADFYVLDSPE